MGFGCLPCLTVPLVPVDHTELNKDELRALYEKSIAVNGGRLFVHGIFARANTRNNNKRVYPKHILEREVARFEVEHIKLGTALGELDHPNYASKYFKCLNLPNVSHQVLEVKWKDDQLWGTIEVLPTPSGLLLWELYSRGLKLGVSSRGWASLKSDPQQKCIYVDDDFELITFDFVTEPSTRGAYLVPIQRAFKKQVPDQSKFVQICHLGHGVVAMEKICRIPEPTTLVQRIAELQVIGIGQATGRHTHTCPCCAKDTHWYHMQRNAQVALQSVPPADAAVLYGESLMQRMPTSFKPSGLDNLLCYSHYVVHQSAAYLDREQHARDYRAHLVIFTARAHMAEEHVGSGGMSRSDMDNVILNQVAARDSFDPASKSFACHLGQPACYGDTTVVSIHSGSARMDARPTSSSSAAAAAAVTKVEVRPSSGRTIAQTDSGIMAWATLPNAPDRPGSNGMDSIGRVAVAAGTSPPHGERDARGAAGLMGPGRSVRTLGCSSSSVQPETPGGSKAAIAATAADVELMASWLGHAPGSDRIAREFARIRETLANYSQLYQVYQQRVEVTLLRQGGPQSRPGT